ncbi:ZAR1-like protein isoform X2 [Acomys russatus]|uniref:ZAR1-like protein isoform X2 n=1 Tax=Acomys russatus TaxID=60746 RepID=UPI0021E22F25|nr:ZAR1-like protein isoform X2 [Acomys russatus]
MDRLVRVPCGLCQGYGHTQPLTHPDPWRQGQQQDWSQNMGAPIFLASPGGPIPPVFLARPIVPANVSESCVGSYNRAQFRATLPQTNTDLSLQLCKVNTKEVGVQVSLRVDKSVQCSLGTLHSSSLVDRASSRKPAEAWGVGRRGLIQLPKDGEDRKSQQLTGHAEASQPLPPTSRPDGDKQKQLPQLKESEEEDPHSPEARKSKQFLEPKYGYFHCKDCKTRWESAYVWCIAGTNKVYFKQLCSKCRKSFNPYRVETIQCQTCSRSRCSCSQKKRHVDLRRPHRQELCGHCKDKKLSCSIFYGFNSVQ